MSNLSAFYKHNRGRPNRISQRCPKMPQTKFFEGGSPWTPPTPQGWVSDPSVYASSPCAPLTVIFVPTGLRGFYLIDRFRQKIILYTNTICALKQARPNNEQPNFAVTSKTYLEMSLKLFIIGVWNKTYEGIQIHILELPKCRRWLQGLLLVVLFRRRGIYYA